MKKNLLVIIPIIILLACLGFGVFFYGQKAREADAVNELVQNWLVENLQNKDALQFVFELETSCDGSRAQYPTDIPALTVETYQVTLLKEKKIAKVERIQSKTYNFEKEVQIPNLGETSYLSVSGDTVSVYTQEDGRYQVRKIQKEGFADALCRLLFPEDVSFLYDENPMQVIVEKEGYPHYSVQRSNIDLTYLYAPFAILKGDAPEEVINYDPNLNFSGLEFGYNDQENLPDWIFRFRIGIGPNAGKFYSYAYEAWTGKPYENELMRKGYSYDQHVMIYFNQDFNEAEPFALPQI